jgi:hypothetical protein
MTEHGGRSARLSCRNIHGANTAYGVMALLPLKSITLFPYQMAVHIPRLICVQRASGVTVQRQRGMMPNVIIAASSFRNGGKDYEQSD